MEIDFTPQAEKALRKIEKSDARIAKSMFQRFEELRRDPMPQSAKKLQGYRQPENAPFAVPFGGDYGRIIYRVKDNILKIIALGPRENIYKQWNRNPDAGE